MAISTGNVTIDKRTEETNYYLESDFQYGEQAYRRTEVQKARSFGRRREQIVHGVNSVKGKYKTILKTPDDGNVSDE